MKKKVDGRIRTLVENGVKTRERTMFFIVGDKGRDQVVNLHYMLSKAVVKARPSVLWCYKTDLYMSSNRKKRAKQIKKLQQRGLLTSETEDPFALFVASTNIRYCYYADTHKVLGNTYGMLVLQDFEAMTPNLLARTIETVEGGGIIVFLISSLDSLSKLYTMSMDVHARFRTESHQDVIARFNERFILSLASCKRCILMDDELNILPTSTHVKAIKAVDDSVATEESEEAKELRELNESLADTQPIGPLVNLCRTIDQGKAVVTFLDAASEKTLRSTVALTASRGRGKSAALGVAIAGALAMGYANIFVTSPSPENLTTLFEFIFKGLDALDYKEHIDYDLVESTNPAFAKAIVRVNVFRNHRQTVQYISPESAERVQHAELLVIDEAAAIPLPVVKALLGPYLVFLCSTVNGYEGTGRSLSLKLISQLREQGVKQGNQAHAQGKMITGGRLLKEVQLQEPIRYAPGDPIESWLHNVLCLNAADHVPRLIHRLPHPSECELYHVNRDALFSHHQASEQFLQRMMALYVASHYKNTPNDLQLMSDAPAHRLFVLLPPVDEASNSMPDILAVVQVALEGAISKQSAKANLARGHAPQGDMIPWTVGQQFQDAELPTLSGVRIVRIAVHPEVTRGGYGTRAVSQLIRYYQGSPRGVGELSDLSEKDAEESGYGEEHKAPQVEQGEDGLLEERLKPRADMPPLLASLGELRPERLHWLGTSFGLTKELLAFWG
ncbi:N-acetyltransferase 10, partial [Cymbomonas tetramitiformis]